MPDPRKLEGEATNPADDTTTMVKQESRTAWVDMMENMSPTCRATTQYVSHPYQVSKPST